MRENESRRIQMPLVKRKRQSGRVCSEAKVSSAGFRDKDGNMRMRGMKHNYNRHKTDE